VAVILHRASGHPERKHEFIWRLKRENTGPDLILDLLLGLGLATLATGTRRRVEADVAQGRRGRGAGSRPTWRRVDGDEAQGRGRRGAGSTGTRRRVEADVAGVVAGVVTSPPFSVIPQLGT
jgi:hypothetical protein